MFESMNKFFSDKITAVPDADEDARRLRVATSALLLEAAHADSDFSDEEKSAILAMLGQRFRLNEQETADLVEVAEQERQQSDSLFEFARLINEEFPRERKLAILQLLWQVVYQDGVLEAHEDALMHKVGKLLGVRHEELMALKIQVKRSLTD
jgi:uncharacterized tellurite resistance protein B-like protein